MKLYDESDPAPNPRRVRIFLKEKDIDIPLVHTPLSKGKHKAPEFLVKNSLGQLPVLELDDGTCISESVAICRYLEELHPEPPLFGSSALERAQVDMWIRRIEFRLMQPVGQIWVNTHPFTAAVVAARGGKQHVEFGESNRPIFESGCKWLNRELEGREFIAGPRYTMADIVAQSTFDFARVIGVTIPDNCTNFLAWYDRVNARPSAALDLSKSLLKLPT
ncbi:MAG: glutathione S-transferase [Alphaproteobacteria bacterium]|nr:glutathione S-transferase [Alphaproteobacteria bacterium]